MDIGLRSYTDIRMTLWKTKKVNSRAPFWQPQKVIWNYFLFGLEANWKGSSQGKNVMPTDKTEGRLVSRTEAQLVTITSVIHQMTIFGCFCRLHLIIKMI